MALKHGPIDEVICAPCEKLRFECELTGRAQRDKNDRNDTDDIDDMVMGA